MKYVSILFGAALLIAGCRDGQLPTNSGSRGSDKPGIVVADYELGAPIIRGNIAIVPILQRSVKEKAPLDDYVLLEEAKKNGWIEISELPGMESVETLLVRNLGPRPILLLAGDLLLGGKQDRIVAKDAIIEPKQTREVSVFCVEHGRWQGSSLRFDGASVGVPSSVRRSAIFRDQQSVWQDVEEKNRALASSPGSTSVRESVNSDRLQRRLASDYGPIFGELSKFDRIVGAVLLLDGEIVSFESFGSRSLFSAGFPTILQGLIAEAESRGDTGIAKSVDLEKCRAFVETALSASRQDTFSDGRMTRSEVAESEIQGMEIRAGAAPGAPSREFVRGTYAPNVDR